jgi:peptidyl-tRNA hydrolase
VESILSSNPIVDENPEIEHHYCYAIARRDLDMSPGKLSAQTGHAYADVLLHALKTSPDKVNYYCDPTTGGSKVSLFAKNEHQLLRALNEARDAGIPAVPVVDMHHVIPGTVFDGRPIVTGIGIGPCTKSQIKHITKRFNCI